LLAGISPACSPRVINAVTLDAGPSTPLIWPNAESFTNSDPWLAQHHQAITEMQPKVLVLHFYNPMTAEEARGVAEKQIAALAEGSRYHGYSDETAPAFLKYEIVKVVDLTDDPVPPSYEWEYVSSTKVPILLGAFDHTALFGQAFADLYGFTDPNNPARNLVLCELFEQGLVNEVWLHVGEPGARAPVLNMERKQVYDIEGNHIPGVFESRAGSYAATGISCGVTVRLAHLSPVRGAGCDLQIRGFGLEAMRLAIPYLEANAPAFLNDDFRSRFDAPFDSWSDLCDQVAAPCVTYPTPTSARGKLQNGQDWGISPFIQGCGKSQFPPNARNRYDYRNVTDRVESRCEHFGMRDGPDGEDLREIYTATEKSEAYDRKYGSLLAFPDGRERLPEGYTDCGGGWQLYWRQSIPGVHNKAIGADGKPMKNWWPFLFY
jgi:hypothetical protein